MKSIAFDSVDKLTPREREVFRLMGEGKTTREIASKLGLSESTIDTHRSEILEKTGHADQFKLRAFATQFIVANKLAFQPVK